MWIAPTPKPPYYVAVFSSVRTETDEGYYQMNDALLMELSKLSGYLGHESARENGCGITVSYWSDLQSLKNWRDLPLHKTAQDLGREKWYHNYKVRIGLIEHDYGFEKQSGNANTISPASISGDTAGV